MIHKTLAVAKIIFFLELVKSITLMTTTRKKAVEAR